ncbi:MAG: hypothetical protein AAGF95_32525 [Chloroflexota bacterium]
MKKKAFGMFAVCCFPQTFVITCISRTVRLGLVGLLASALVSCALPTGDTSDLPNQIGLAPEQQSSLPPEAVVQSFFEDFNFAFNDPLLLEDVDRRGQWIDQLVSYFVPSERIEHRSLFAEAFRTYSTGQYLLGGNNETMTLEVRFDEETIESEITDNRALVRLPDAVVCVIITSGAATADDTCDDESDLDTLIGTEDGAVPLIRVGGRWFLTSDVE